MGCLLGKIDRKGLFTSDIKVFRLKNSEGKLAGEYLTKPGTYSKLY
jgi:hypothetical protein